MASNISRRSGVSAAVEVEEEEEEEERGKPLREGERVVGPTRRPDGTLRKPIRIRPGYVPQDEVAIYQSKGAKWKKELESQVGPPGFVPDTEAKPKSKSVKRNERKKEKRQQAAVERGKNPEDTGDQDTEEVNHADVESIALQVNQLAVSKNPAASKSSANSQEELNADSSGVDIDKKIRALKKKIRLAEAQLQKASPEDMKPEQLEKVKKLEGWREDLKLLEVEKVPESSAS